jgi:hypothetical protein
MIFATDADEDEDAEEGEGESDGALKVDEDGARAGGNSS